VFNLSSNFCGQYMVHICNFYAAYNTKSSNVHPSVHVVSLYFGLGITCNHYLPDFLTEAANPQTRAPLSKVFFSS